MQRNISRYAKYICENICRYAKYVRERGEVEREYARALRKLVARYKQLSAPGNNDMIMMSHNNNDEIDDDS